MIYALMYLINDNMKCRSYHGKNWNQFSSLCYNKICISGWYWIFYAFNLRLEFTILILGCFPFTLASIHRGVLQEEFGSLRKPQHGLRVHPDQARGGAAEVRDHIAHTVWETKGHIAHTIWEKKGFLSSPDHWYQKVLRLTWSLKKTLLLRPTWSKTRNKRFFSSSDQWNENLFNSPDLWNKGHLKLT